MGECGSLIDSLVRCLLNGPAVDVYLERGVLERRIVGFHHRDDPIDRLCDSDSLRGSDTEVVRDATARRVTFEVVDR